MESSYTLALKELEQIRAKNREIDELHRKEVIKKAPEIENIEKELMKCGTRLLKCVLDKSENFEEVKENIQALQKKKYNLLDAAGFSKDYLDDTVTCKLCGDTGFDKDGKRCTCHKMLILKYISKNSNLTECMLTQKFENFDFSLFTNQGPSDSGTALKIARKLSEKALDYAENFDKTGENLFILGNSGTGKTYLSSCIANRALERGKTVYYQSAYQLFDMFEKVKFQKTDGQDFEETIKYVYNVDLLIIDDLGTEFITQYTSATFFDILNSRINNKKSTIISTNLSMENIDQMYGTRVVSRIYGDYTALMTTGCDLREVKKNRNKKS